MFDAFTLTAILNMAINYKKYAKSLILSFITILIVDILLHAVILRGVWVKTKNYWLPSDEMNRLVPWAWFSLLVTLFFYGLIFTRLKNKSLKEGLILGLFLGLASFSGALGLLTIVPWPKAIVIGMAIQQLINNIFLGLIFGRFYKD